MKLVRRVGADKGEEVQVSAKELVNLVCDRVMREFPEHIGRNVVLHFKDNISKNDEVAVTVKLRKHKK